MGTSFNHNGKLFAISDPAISVLNHSYRYGDGIFETMKIINGQIPLFEYHIRRLYFGMQVLGFKVPVFFSKKSVEREILKLAEKNNCIKLARIRLTVSRGNGGVNDCDDILQYTIECMAADESFNCLNENGFVIAVFPDAIKSCDTFSNLKSSSYMQSIMAARFAEENKLNDALILNQHKNICETAIANIFWVKKNIVYTPPLSEGCVAGVMRKYLLEKIPRIKIGSKEKILTIEELKDADEVFLTNAMYGMRWVSRLGDQFYKNIYCHTIFQSVVSSLWK